MKFSSVFILLALLSLPGDLAAQTIDILWQGNGYTLPFYQGGSPWGSEGRINFLAIPQGLGDPTTLTYKWTQNGTVLGNISGRGRNTLGIKDSIFSKPQTIKVEIMSPFDDVLASSEITITPTTPTPLVYERHPLYGFMFHLEASGGYRFSGDEITFAAFPLFFTASNREDKLLKYSWKSNAGDDGSLSFITYRVPENSSGSASIALTLLNTDTLRQTSSKNFLVQFGNGNE